MITFFQIKILILYPNVKQKILIHLTIQVVFLHEVNCHIVNCMLASIFQIPLYQYRKSILNHLLCIIHALITIMKMSIYNIKTQNKKLDIIYVVHPIHEATLTKACLYYFIKEYLQFRGTYTTNRFHREYSPITTSFLVIISFWYIINIQNYSNAWININQCWYILNIQHISILTQ